MEQNYYDILEINKNASPEIIEKAYKTLVKKYHPDLQDDNLKIKYEEKIKKINEAYEILSDIKKRKNYDLNLKNIEISIEDYNNLYNENINLKKEINILKNNLNSNSNYNNIENEINQRINDAVNKAYYDAYIQDLKNRGYKIKYKKNFKDFLALVITILIFLSVGFILCNIPFTKNLLINLYKESPTLQLIVSIFGIPIKI